MAVYGYARVSTEDQAAPDRMSLEDQQNRIRIAAERAKLDIARMFVEAGFSAAKEFSGRPESSQLWELLQPGDYIIAAKMDRMFRSSANALATMETFAKRGIRVIIENMGTDPINESIVGRLMTGLLNVVAQFERETILERTSAGRRAKKDRNGHIGGSTPFEYDKVGTGRGAILVRNEQRTAAVEKIKSLAAEGKGYRDISEKMKESGITISHMGVKRVLLRSGPA